MSVRPVLALVLGVVAAVAIGCGGDRSSLLSGADAAGLKDELSAVQTALEDGKCAQATQAAQAFERAARDLPTSVDPELRARLRKGAASLVAGATNDCVPPTTPTTPTTPTVPTTPTTPTTPTVPTTPTTPTTPTPPGDGTGGTGVGEATP